VIKKWRDKEVALQTAALVEWLVQEKGISVLLDPSEDLLTGERPLQHRGAGCCRCAVLAATGVCHSSLMLTPVWRWRQVHCAAMRRLLFCFNFNVEVESVAASR
jgi:hypothetical protein